MAGSQALPFHCRSLAVAFSVSLLTLVSAAQAQNRFPSPLTSVDSATAAEMTPVSMTASSPAYCPADGEVYCNEMGCCDTIRESLCGDNPWRPLSLDTFFSEGWNEPWAGGPAGESGLTPRHGWLGAFEGVFYRLWLVSGTYQHDLNQPYGGDAYRGNVSTFLPLSRRFEIYIDAPFVAANGTEDPTRGYASNFGDISVAASFLLSETVSCTQLFTLGAIVPTGDSETGGDLSALNPRYSFWSNPCGAWVVRGGTGVNIPLDSSDDSKWNVDVAAGRYFRPHDVPFGDLVFYVNCNATVPIENDGSTQIGVGPGTRFQIGGDWYFLNYWEFQPRSNNPFDFQMQAAIVKAF